MWKTELSQDGASFKEKVEALFYGNILVQKLKFTVTLLNMRLADHGNSDRAGQTSLLASKKQDLREENMS